MEKIPINFDREPDENISSEKIPEELKGQEYRDFNLGQRAGTQIYADYYEKRIELNEKLSEARKKGDSQEIEEIEKHLEQLGKDIEKAGNMINDDDNDLKKAA